MIKTFVFPVVGKCQHAVFVAESGWTMCHSVCGAFQPPDDARFQSYNLAYDDIAADQNLWRPATRLETVVFLADLDVEDLDQLIAVDARPGELCEVSRAAVMGGFAVKSPLKHTFLFGGWYRYCGKDSRRLEVVL